MRFRTLACFVLVATAAVGLGSCGGDDKGSSSTTAATSAGTTATGGTGTTAAGGAAAGGCGDLTAVTAVQDFKPVKADTLSIVTSLPGPGFFEGSDTDTSAIKAGYEYCLAKAIQQAVGAKNLSVRNENFDAIVAGTVTDYDLALSQVSITDDRKKVVDFTDPYFESQQGVLIKTGSNVKVATVDDARKLQWGIQTSTTAFDMLQDLIKPTKQPNVFQQLPDAYTALDAGQVDAVLIDTAINLGEAARSKGEFQVVAQFAQPSGPDEYGGIVPKGSTNLPALNRVIDGMKASGLLKQLATSQLTADPGNIPTITVS